MPTVSNHDVLGPMTWGAGGNNARQRYFPQDSLDPQDARGGINSLLFGEASASAPGAGGACAAGLGHGTSSEHAYAAGGQPPLRSFVSENGYYGYHQRHPAGLGHPAGADDAAGLGQDCSMDTSENNLPAHAFGEHPSGLGGGACVSFRDHSFGNGGHQLRFHEDPFRGQTATRKRGLEARGGWDAVGDLAEDAARPCPAVKRTRTCGGREDRVLAEASSQAMAQAFGMHTSAPSTASIAEQSHSPAQTYDLPIQQLPGSTSQLADALTPRPRCLMGHFI